MLTEILVEALSNDVMAQGDAMHPDKQWKLNRKINQLKGQK